MFTKTFWLETIDRLIKSAAQGVILGLALAEGANLFEMDGMAALGFAGGAALLSLLTSLISAPFNVKGTASLIQ
jgi:hypothetical protein